MSGHNRLINVLVSLMDYDELILPVHILLNCYDLNDKMPPNTHTSIWTRQIYPPISLEDQKDYAGFWCQEIHLVISIDWRTPSMGLVRVNMLTREAMVNHLMSFL